MKKAAFLLILIFCGGGALCQPASGTIYFADGVKQNLHSMHSIWGSYYEQNIFLYGRSKGKINVFYNNTYRVIDFKDFSLNYS